jgi:phosphorylcholine metabolism protein LicD
VSGIVKLGTMFISLLTDTVAIQIKDMKTTDLNTFTTSVKPVCLIILLKDPTTKKLIADITKTNGSAKKNCFKSKSSVKLNLIKYAKKKVAKIKHKSIPKTSHLEAYFCE